MEKNKDLSKQLDLLKIERKINKAISLRNQQSVESYASEKIQNIYKFLEQVETDSQLSESTTSSGTTTGTQSKSQQKDNQVELINREKEIMKTISDNKAKYNQMKIELEEANKTIESLREMLEKDKIKYKESIRNLEQEYQLKLNEQKEELEGVVERHLKFIDQLIIDKKELSQQVEVLLDKLRIEENKNNKINAEWKDKLQRELKSNRELILSQENKKREKWLQDKTKEIKEITIKGLEPEIQRILNKSKQDIKEAEEKFKKEFIEQKENIIQEYEDKFKNYKEKYLLENQSIVAKERDIVHLRLKEHYERMEQQFLEDRERMKKTFHTELEDLERLRKRDLDSFHERMKKLQDSHFNEMVSTREEFEKKLDKIRQSHKQEVQTIQENIQTDKDQWINSQKQLFEEELSRRTHQIKQSLLKERDAQLEKIIDKLSQETGNKEEELSRKYELKVKNMQELHNEELKNHKKEIEILTNQVTENSQIKQHQQNDLQQLKKNINELQIQIEARDKDIAELKSKVLYLESEKTCLSEYNKVIENDWRNKFLYEKAKYDEEIIKSNKNLGSVKISYEQQIEKIEAKNLQQLEEVENRVKNALARRDQEIQRIQADLREKDSLCKKYEQLLDKQRRDLMHP